MTITNKWGHAVNYEVMLSGGPPPILDSGRIENDQSHTVPDEVLDPDKVYAVTVNLIPYSSSINGSFISNNLSKFSDVTIVVTNTR